MYCVCAHVCVFVRVCIRPHTCVHIIHSIDAYHPWLHDITIHPILHDKPTQHNNIIVLHINITTGM